MYTSNIKAEGSVDVGGRLVGLRSEEGWGFQNVPRPEYIHEHDVVFSGEQAGTGEIGKADGKQGVQSGQQSFYLYALLVCVVVAE